MTQLAHMTTSDVLNFLDFYQFDNGRHFCNAITAESDGRVWVDQLLTDEGLLRAVGRNRIADVVAVEIISFEDGSLQARWPDYTSRPDPRTLLALYRLAIAQADFYQRIGSEHWADAKARADNAWRKYEAAKAAQEKK